MIGRETKSFQSHLNDPYSYALSSSCVLMNFELLQQRSCVNWTKKLKFWLNKFEKMPNCKFTRAVRAWKYNTISGRNGKWKFIFIQSTAGHTICLQLTYFVWPYTTLLNDRTINTFTFLAQISRVLQRCMYNFYPLLYHYVLC